MYRYAYIYILLFFPELCTYKENIKIKDADNKADRIIQY